MVRRGLAATLLGRRRRNRVLRRRRDGPGPRCFLLLGRRQDGVQDGAFHARHELHHAGFADVLDEAVDDGVAQFAIPPVCRIQDYGRFLYEKEKSERAVKKKQKVITVKEVKFSVTVDYHDYQTKKNKVLHFLADGDKVKASLRFRGRHMAHRDLGYNIINRLIQDVGDAAIVEFMPRMEGTILHAILAAAKKQEAPKPKPAAAPQAAPKSAPAAATKLKAN